MQDKTSEHTVLRGKIFATARDPEGNVKWREEVENVHMNDAIDDILEAYFKAGSGPATLFVGLADGTPTFDATDTMGSHSGWAEVTDYDEAAREEWVDDAVSGQAISNATTVAAFTISTGGATVGGAFMTTDNTKGGTAGVLVSGSAFGGGDRALSESDTLEIEYEHSAS